VELAIIVNLKAPAIDAIKVALFVVVKLVTVVVIE